MRDSVISKPEGVRKSANMPDYDARRAAFTWAEARERLSHLPDGRINITHEAVDRHLAEGHGDRLALRWLAKSGEPVDFTYRDLVHRTNRFANVLRQLGCERGTRVYSLLGRRPELFITALGTMKAGGVFCPLFSAFGPEPIHARMEIGDAEVLVTNASLYRRRVAALRAALPGLRHVLIVDGAPEGTESFTDLMDAASEDFEPEPM